jgi:hypothetical protein
METMLRLIGNMFLHVANTIHKANDSMTSFFFGILLEGDHLEGADSDYPDARKRVR